MIKRIAIFTLVFALAAAVVFTGCTPARRPYDNGQYNNGYNTGYDYRYNLGTNRNVNYQTYPNAGNNWGTGEWNNNYMGNNNPLNNNQNVNTVTNTTDSIARACERVQGVEDATVVLTGNTAYVGIDKDNNANTANETDIKNRVAQAVRRSGPNINTVYVSADPDFITRLRNVGQGIRNGRPVGGFTTELNQMIQNLTPTRW